MLEEAAIKVLPIALAKGGSDAHYRFGWEEKGKGGGFRGETIDLPNRGFGPGMDKFNKDQGGGG